jgi:menaquinone-dependent protoporphyrinogen oxidase
MAPILILFGTVDGQTSKIAGFLAEALRRDGAEVDVRDAARQAGRLSTESYAGVIVAAPVRAGSYPRTVRRWVRANADALSKRPSAFLSVCLAVLQNSPETQREIHDILERFFQSSGWRPGIVKPVAGALPYTRYGWLKRWLLRRIVRRHGGDTDSTRDFEYTDWEDLRAFAHTFHELVYGPSMKAAAG